MAGCHVSANTAAKVKLEKQRVNELTRQANNSSAVYVTAVSVYASTHGASQERKEEEVKLQYYKLC